MGGITGAPAIDAGMPIPPPGTGGTGGTTAVPAAPGDAYYLLLTADSRLPNSVVFAGPVKDGTSAPTNTAFFWGDTTTSPKVLKYYDSSTATWMQFSGGSSSTWLNSNGPPTTTPANGAYDIDVGGGATNGQLWQYQSGTWVLLTTIEGAAGVSVSPQGAWASGTAYVANDLVTYDGLPYLAVADSTNIQPGTDPTKWMLLFTVGIFGASGSGHSTGLVPDPGATAGTTRYLREDGTWTAPPVNAGTVTSVALSMPTTFAVTGSPIAGAGTLSVAWNAVSAAYVLAGPASGAAAAPAFRTLVGSDVPTFGASGASHAQGTVPDPGATAGSTRYLREDGSWAVPTGTGITSLPTDYISGLILSWVSATQIQVNTGTCYSPAASGTITVSAAFTVTPTVAASTMYYVYLTGTGSASVSTTAPTNYQGTAWEDGSGHRYIGAFLTDSSSNIINFQRRGTRVYYRANTGGVQFALVTNGFGSSTSIAAGGVVPATSTVMMAMVSYVTGNPTPFYIAFGTSDGVASSSTSPGSGSLVFEDVGSGSGSYLSQVSFTADILLNSTQHFLFSGSLSVNALGYEEDR